MGKLLRRRALMLPGEVTPREWDYEWDYTKGLLDQNNNGFSYKKVGGTGYACAIVDDYLRFRGSSANYKLYNYGRTFSTGVMEAEIWGATNAVMLLAFSNGAHSIGIGLRVSSSTMGIYLGTDTSTKLMSATYERKYKVRLVLKSGLLGDVYVDDNLIASSVDVSTDDVPNIRITGKGTGSGNVYSRLYSLKMKFNRTE